MSASQPLTGDELAHYGAALDEVYALRRLLAYHARVLEATLDYKTFPKSRRETSERQVTAMRRAAMGHGLDELANLNSRTVDGCMARLGQRTTLTRAAWESRDRTG